jgi:hypothetical protein
MHEVVTPSISAAWVVVMVRRFFLYSFMVMVSLSVD